MSSSVTESGITITVSQNHDNPTNSEIFFNPNTRIARELSLLALQTFSEQWNKDGPIKCLDAFGATGVAGLQWKKLVGRRAEVTINDLSHRAVQQIRDHATHNGFVLGRNTPSFPTQGDLLPPSLVEKSSAENESGEQDAASVIEVTQSDANVILHQRQFNFIHLDPFGSTVQFLDAAFRNAFHGAIIVLVSTDIAALFGKAPDVLTRNYGAVSVRTDFTREAAVRIVLANAAQSAARCNKGFTVLYAAAEAHFVTVAVRIKRGAKHGNTNMSLVRSVLHCRLCEDWGLLERSNTPPDDVYAALPCRCHSEQPGQTGQILGPMWCGSLAEVAFLRLMLRRAETSGLPRDSLSLLRALVEEAECVDSEDTDQPESQTAASGDRRGADTAQQEPVVKKMRCGDESTESVEPRLAAAGCRDCSVSGSPMFYYNLHNRKLSNIDLPRTTNVVKLLHKEGFRASRTHFDPLGVRTNATSGQLATVLQKYCSQSSTR